MAGNGSCPPGDKCEIEGMCGKIAGHVTTEAEPDFF